MFDRQAFEEPATHLSRAADRHVSYIDPNYRECNLILLATVENKFIPNLYVMGPDTMAIVSLHVVH
ncbi:hypothetical protein FPOAC2_00511 [Fusarium poae]